MNPAYIFLIIGLLLIIPIGRADTLVLKNGDHLTGTVVSSGEKALTLNTDFAGEIKVKWATIAEVRSDQPLYVVTSDKKTLNGNVTTENGNLVVHTKETGAVPVPFENVIGVRSEDAQAAYEKSQHPGILEAWRGGANVGFALGRGNSETTNLAAGFTAVRKTPRDEISLYFTSLYASDDRPGGGTTANLAAAGARYDRNLNKRIFVFGSADFTHDGLQGLNVRSIYSGGLGFHLINTDKTTLDLLVGVDYTRETYSGTTKTGGAGSDRNLAGATTGESFVHKFGSTTVLTEQFYLYPNLINNGRYRFALDALSVTKINKWFGLQLSISDRYVSNPPIVGTKPNDLILSTGINFAFNH